MDAAALQANVAQQKEMMQILAAQKREEKELEAKRVEEEKRARTQKNLQLLEERLAKRSGPPATKQTSPQISPAQSPVYTHPVALSVGSIHLSPSHAPPLLPTPTVPPMVVPEKIPHPPVVSWPVIMHPPVPLTQSTMSNSAPLIIKAPLLPQPHMEPPKILHRPKVEPPIATQKTEEKIVTPTTVKSEEKSVPTAKGEDKPPAQPLRIVRTVHPTPAPTTVQPAPTAVTAEPVPALVASPVIPPAITESPSPPLQEDTLLKKLATQQGTVVVLRTTKRAEGKTKIESEEVYQLTPLRSQSEPPVNSEPLFPQARVRAVRPLLIKRETKVNKEESTKLPATGTVSSVPDPIATEPIRVVQTPQCPPTLPPTKLSVKVIKKDSSEKLLQKNVQTVVSPQIEPELPPTLESQKLPEIEKDKEREIEVVKEEKTQEKEPDNELEKEEEVVTVQDTDKEREKAKEDQDKQDNFEKNEPQPKKKDKKKKKAKAVPEVTEKLADDSIRSQIIFSGNQQTGIEHSDPDAGDFITVKKRGSKKKKDKPAEEQNQKKPTKNAPVLSLSQNHMEQKVKALSEAKAAQKDTPGRTRAPSSGEQSRPRVPSTGDANRPRVPSTGAQQTRPRGASADDALPTKMTEGQQRPRLASTGDVPNRPHLPSTDEKNSKLEIHTTEPQQTQQSQPLPQQQALSLPPPQNQPQLAATVQADTPPSSSTPSQSTPEMKRKIVIKLNPQPEQQVEYFILVSYFYRSLINSLLELHTSIILYFPFFVHY